MVLLVLSWGFVSHVMGYLSWGFCWSCHKGFVGLSRGVCWFCHEGFVGFVMNGFVVFVMRICGSCCFFFHGGLLVLSWCFVGFITNGFVDFVMRVCWSCHGVLLVLSSGFCCFCHGGFVIRILLVLSWGLLVCHDGFRWFCHVFLFCRKFFIVGFVMGSLLES